jgi:NitT/TauT family transport system substrate-binding protein
MNGSRRLLLVSALLVAAGATAARAQSPLRINVGIANSATDVGLFVADKKGYFKDEGLDVNFIAFDSGARMIAPFASGDLDVGAGGPSAGLYNAVARGIDIRIVADKASTPKGRPINFLLVRKDLVDSGRFKTLADLKGMKIAGSAPGGAATTTLDKLLDKAGLRMADIERVYLGFPQQAIALQNKAVEAALPTEPSASKAVNMGAATRIIGDDEIYPGHQLAVILYTGRFIQTKPEAARKFMRAYLRGVRDYSDAIEDGYLRGPKGEEVISILTTYSSIKDPQIYRSIKTANIDPDGKLGIASIKEDLDIFTKEKLIEGKVDIDKVIDTSFAEAVVRELGPYKRASP